MKILVTGATGFIGKNLVKRLVSKGFSVTCLVRNESKKDDILFLKNLGVNLIYGYITKKGTLKNLFDDVSVVFHLAGLLGSYNISNERYYNIHVNGTKNLLSLCTNQKFIYLSSAGVVGPVVNGTESTNLNPTNVYEDTKAEAEELVKNYINYVILRPEFVFGPNDRHVLLLFKSILNKKFYIIGNDKSLLHPTYIDDLIYCLIKCMDDEIKNEMFFIAGERSVTVSEFVKLISKELNVKYNKIKIPVILANIYSILIFPLAKLFNFDPILTKSRIDFFTKSRSFNIEKAREILNYRPTKFESGLKKTIQWYKENGYL